MKFKVDWVSEDQRSFAVVAWSRDRDELFAAYTGLDDIPNSDGVFSGVTERAAILACCRGSVEDASRHIVKESQNSRAYLMRMVLPSHKPVKINDELTLAKVRKIAGV